MASNNVPAVLAAGSGMGVGQSDDLLSKLLDATRLVGELQTEIKHLNSELSSLKASHLEDVKASQSENADLLRRMRDQAHDATKLSEEVTKRSEEVTKRYGEAVQRYEEAITILKASREADKPILRQIDKVATELLAFASGNKSVGAAQIGSANFAADAEETDPKPVDNLRNKALALALSAKKMEDFESIVERVLDILKTQDTVAVKACLEEAMVELTSWKTSEFGFLQNPHTNGMQNMAIASTLGYLAHMIQEEKVQS
ncbi:hypothetical protein HK405_013130, partial [Cladochytrium tenue]